jgi:putative ABC transport system substrate-binding protein
LYTILTEFRNRGIKATFTAVNVNYVSKEKEASLARFEQAVQAAQADQADLIFSAGSDATKVFFENYADTVGIPIVSVNAKDPVILKQLPDYETGSGNWMAFTSLNVPIDLQMNYLLQLKPNLKNIAILYSSLNTSAVETQANPVREAAQAMGINVLDVDVENYETVKEELAQKVPLAVAEIKKTDPGQQDSIFLITGVTEIFEQIAIINQYSDQIAVLSVVPDNVKPGDDSAALAIGVGFISNAQVAAYYGTQILGGTAPGSLKVGIVSPPDIAINFKRARAIGMKIPFTFFESASFVYDGIGQLVRKNGQTISPQGVPVVVAPVIPVQPTATPFALLPVVELVQPTTAIESTPTAAPPEPTATPTPQLLSGISPDNATQVVNLKQLRDSGGNRIQISPNGQLAAVYNPNLYELILYSIPDLGKKFTITPGLMTSMAFSPDGGLLAVTGVDASITLWNTADGSLSTRLTGLGRAATGLAFSPDGNTLASASPDGLWLWPLAGGNPVKYAEHKSDTVFFASDGQTILVGHGNRIRAVNVSDGVVIREILVGRLISASVNGQWVAAGTPQGSIQIYSMQDGTRLAVLSGSNPAEWSSGAFSPDGKIFAMIDQVGANHFWIRLWNLTTGQTLHSLGDYRNAFANLAFTPDGQSLMSITGDEWIDVWGIP